MSGRLLVRELMLVSVGSILFAVAGPLAGDDVLRSDAVSSTPTKPEIKVELARAIESLNGFQFEVTGSLGGPASYSRGSYAHDRRYVDGHSGVTRILRLTHNRLLDKVDCLRLAVRLKAELKAAADGYEDLCRELDGELSVSSTDSRGADLFRRSSLGPTCVYLLSELRCFDALPMMATVFEQLGRLPVSRSTLFYAMHLLVVEHPREGLSPGAREALEKYLETTGPLPLPLAARSGGRIYPVYFESAEEGRSQASEEVNTYFQQLRQFINLAYPRQ